MEGINPTLLLFFWHVDIPVDVVACLALLFLVFAVCLAVICVIHIPLSFYSAQPVNILFHEEQ